MKISVFCWPAILVADAYTCPPSCTHPHAPRDMDIHMIINGNMNEFWSHSQNNIEYFTFY